jgi:hypothetical protein
MLVVVNTESDEREIVGEYVGIDEDVVFYTRPDGSRGEAPADFVAIERQFTISRRNHTTALAALIHYALHVADPETVIATLETLQPQAENLNRKPWAAIIAEARAQHRLNLDAALEAAEETV